LATLNYFGGIDWYELTTDHPAVRIRNDESEIFEGTVPVSLAFLTERDLVVGNVAQEFMVLKSPNQDPKALQEHISCNSCRLATPDGFAGNSMFIHLAFCHIHHLQINYHSFRVVRSMVCPSYNPKGGESNQG
jgi:hypothetical protein